jgi:microcystin degradation protein MlrC
LFDRKAPRSFVCLFDPESALQASIAGAGATVPMRLGGKSDELHGPPLEGTFTVVSLHDGRFSESETRHGGFTHCDQGATAVVRSDAGLTVMLTSKRMPPFSLQQIVSCGIDPGQYHILVAKGVNAPVAAYSPVCKHLIRVNTPGCTSADMTSLRFEHRRKPMFPFE